jgi:hypothetical protein
MTVMEKIAMPNSSNWCGFGIGHMWIQTRVISIIYNIWDKLAVPLLVFVLYLSPRLVMQNESEWESLLFQYFSGSGQTWVGEVGLKPRRWRALAIRVVHGQLFPRADIDNRPECLTA